MNKKEQAMFNALVEIDKGTVINEDFYKTIDESISELNKHLFIIWWKQVWRDNEARKNKKAISTTELNCIVFKKLDELRKKEADLFYFPSLIAFDKDMKEIYFCDETALQCALRIVLLSNLKITFPPELTLENILDFRNYVLTIKKLFSLMAQNIDTPLLKVRVGLMLILQTIQSITVNTHRKMLQEEFEKEKMRARNRENVTGGKHGTHFKINKIKLSDQYPKLKKMLNEFDGAQEKKTAIDRILGKILKTKNEKTMRKYRQYLLDNFDHEKQDIIQ